MVNLSFLKDKKVLFVEDDLITREKMTKIFSMIFAKVIVAKDGEEAFCLFEDESPDIVISDIKMPKSDGITLARRIRQYDYNTPIILMTSFSERDLLFEAVNLSIDGYLIKPVEFNNLTETLLRSFKRLHVNENLILIGKNLFYNIATKEVYRDGEQIILGVKETNLLSLLIKNRNRTVTLEEISYCLWSLEQMGESALKNTILRIKKKLNEDIIISVRGIGYRINILKSNLDT